MNICNLCKKETLTELLNLGPQAICNRFLIDIKSEEYKHPMVIGQCNVCGLIQIVNPTPSIELLPGYEWITYNEPETHLDHMVKTIVDLPGISTESVICGISFKDDSTLYRFKKHGFKNTWRIDLKNDLGINDSKAGLETIQEFFVPEIANNIAKKRGKADIVIARHILEHAHNPYSFMQALRNLVNPGGYIVFEVPDCLQALKDCDYTTLWEEHTLYFTPMTFKNCFSRSGFSLYNYECYPNPFENSLVGIVQFQEQIIDPFLSEEALGGELSRARFFAENLPKYSVRLRKFLSEYKQNYGKIALFGAGHLACTYINLLGLEGIVDFIVDDNPNKRGLFMPGSRLPLYGSSSLIEENVRLCLLSLNPISEDKVIKINQEFLNRGGTFSSIFPSSKRALKI